MGLLADKNKSLILLCVNGHESDQFARILKWYQLLTENVPLIVNLLSSDLSQINLTLSIIRCGLFSRSDQVASLCI